MHACVVIIIVQLISGVRVFEHSMHVACIYENFAGLGVGAGGGGGGAEPPQYLTSNLTQWNLQMEKN